MRAKPTPSGVPVAITSPGSSVIPLLSSAIRRGTEKIIFDGIAVLLFDAVATKAQLERVRIADFLGRDDPRTDGAGRVETLALEPLTVLALQIARGHVVERGISEDDVERLVLRNVLALRRR